MSKKNSPEARWLKKQSFQKKAPFPVPTAWQIPDYFQALLSYRQSGGEVHGTGYLIFEKVIIDNCQELWKLVQSDLDENGRKLALSLFWSADNLRQYKRNGILSNITIMKEPEHIIPII